MTNRDGFGAWLTNVVERPLPQNMKARARVLAKELAEGAYAPERFWGTTFTSDQHERHLTGDPLDRYLEHRWNNAEPHFELLERLGYLERGDRYVFRLSKLAMELVDEVEPATVFISYSRKQSSAFALLIHTWLNKEGYTAFLDKELNAGVQWRDDLRKRIQGCDFLVAVFGKETFPSTNIVDELAWAYEAGIRIIPIWHEGYDFQTARPHLPEELFDILDELNAVRILEENPLQYEAAILAVINRFQVTPE
ncbi:MAG: toll/interleukin-1 receptor domain-containing protein [Anaerolineae bacterium]|nr:toll/interleukin-1 receptor domain-containing protein [Anaerolineae bacterium]